MISEQKIAQSQRYTNVVLVSPLLTLDRYSQLCNGLYLFADYFLTNTLTNQIKSY